MTAEELADREAEDEADFLAEQESERGYDRMLERRAANGSWWGL
jgi:hypothetical protein